MKKTNKKTKIPNDSAIRDCHDDWPDSLAKATTMPPAVDATTFSNALVFSKFEF
jgi:hypothetical protein